MPRAKRERADFSLRLGNSLSAAGWVTLSPTRLAMEFNWLAGDCAVTIHAARKWIVGEAIPTQARIVVLANWLKVNVEWLRFGDDLKCPLPLFEAQDHVLLIRMALLDERHKKMAFEMMRMLLRVGSKPVVPKKLKIVAGEFVTKQRVRKGGEDTPAFQTFSAGAMLALDIKKSPRKEYDLAKCI